MFQSGVMHGKSQCTITRFGLNYLVPVRLRNPIQIRMCFCCHARTPHRHQRWGEAIRGKQRKGERLTRTIVNNYSQDLLNRKENNDDGFRSYDVFDGRCHCNWQCFHTHFYITSLMIIHMQCSRMSFRGDDGMSKRVQAFKIWPEFVESFWAKWRFFYKLWRQTFLRNSVTYRYVYVPSYASWFTRWSQLRYEISMETMQPHTNIISSSITPILVRLIVPNWLFAITVRKHNLFYRTITSHQITLRVISWLRHIVCHLFCKIEYSLTARWKVQLTFLGEQITLCCSVRHWCFS